MSLTNYCHVPTNKVIYETGSTTAQCPNKLDYLRNNPKSGFFVFTQA